MASGNCSSQEPPLNHHQYHHQLHSPHKMMMPGKLRDYVLQPLNWSRRCRCVKPKKRKNIIALIFLLLYSHGQGPRGSFFKRRYYLDGRIALPACVIFLYITSSLRSAAAVNVSTNNGVEDNQVNKFSTDHDAPLMTTTTATTTVTATGERISTLLDRLVVISPTASVMATSSSTTTKDASDKHLVHRLRYSQHSAGVYSSHLQHLDDDDDYVDKDDEEMDEGAGKGVKKKNNTGKDGMKGGEEKRGKLALLYSGMLLFIYSVVSVVRLVKGSLSCSHSVIVSQSKIQSVIVRGVHIFRI